MPPLVFIIHSGSSTPRKTIDIPHVWDEKVAPPSGAGAVAAAAAAKVAACLSETAPNLAPTSPDASPFLGPSPKRVFPQWLISPAT